MTTSVAENPRNIYRVSREWMSRPADERFVDLEELHEATLRRADTSRVDLIESKAIEVLPAQDSLEVAVEDRRADFSHWSFGQLCQRAQVPAMWARDYTHPEIASLALNYGLQVRSGDDDVMLYSFTQEDAEGRLQVRAATSPSYGRIYDHRVVQAVMRVNEDGRWTIPVPNRYLKADGAERVARESARQRSTLFASDRDVFIFLVDQVNPLEVKRPDGGVDTMYRGFFTWNSEVGSASFGLAWFLWNTVCENRIIWGVQDYKELRIRHTSGGPDRFEREGRQLLARYADSSAKQSVETIQRAMERRVAKDEDEVTAFLRRNRFTLSEAKRAIARAKGEEGKAETVWDLVQGGTAAAREIQHTDSRIDLERKASGLLRHAQA